MSAQYVNKVIYGNTTLIDLTSDDVTASDVLNGKKVHLPSGQQVTGTSTYDADTTESNPPTASEILSGKKAWANGSEIAGTMPNIGEQTSTISAKAQEVTINAGYHDGTGTVSIATAEQAKIIAGNIKEGVSILGVTGTHSGTEDVKATQVNATPYTTAQTIMPEDLGDFNYISEVNISAIAYTEVDNPQGGKTVTIGTVSPED